MIAPIMEMNPIKVTTGATLIRRALNISGLKVVSLELAPLISINPMTTTAIPIANNI